MPHLIGCNESLYHRHHVVYDHMIGVLHSISIWKCTLRIFSFYIKLIYVSIWFHSLTRNKIFLFANHELKFIFPECIFILIMGYLSYHYRLEKRQRLTLNSLAIKRIMYIFLDMIIVTVYLVGDQLKNLVPGTHVDTHIRTNSTSDLQTKMYKKKDKVFFLNIITSDPRQNNTLVTPYWVSWSCDKCATLLKKMYAD